MAAFLVVWFAAAIAPRYRADWLLENLLTFVALPVLIWSYRRFRLTDQAYLLTTAFLVLHTIGSHYTYSEVPIGEYARDTFGLSRNHYDRVVHLSFGLLLTLPIAEWIGHRFRGLSANASLWASFLAIAAASSFYEMLEWIVGMVVAPEAGNAYLGTQGDEWDAQKDMALASIGALAAVLWLRRRRPGSCDQANEEERGRHGKNFGSAGFLAD